MLSLPKRKMINSRALTQTHHRYQTVSQLRLETLGEGWPFFFEDRDYSPASWLHVRFVDRWITMDTEFPDGLIPHDCVIQPLFWSIWGRASSGIRIDSRTLRWELRPVRRIPMNWESIN
jgi:hypothetical protein